MQGLSGQAQNTLIEAPTPIEDRLEVPQPMPSMKDDLSVGLFSNQSKSQQLPMKVEENVNMEEGDLCDEHANSAR